ncbi:hypothetical protein [Pseudomonas sp. RIT-PI-AD]|uniref:hypothetical protein n=1 Tax=Pseudomonas sp. RIT-PI-AD TaxID=3035294 RepID=UPI0021D8ED84|nr:hypothetical protein [Pseudomonas sp. RIT-PI-AD]
MNRPLLALLLGLLLSACAAVTPLPERAPTLALPLSLHVQRLDGPAQDSLLVIQAERERLRWSLFDPLGVPLSRQLLERGAWHNDGLLPPNPAARELFAALLFALTPATQLPALYPAGRWRQDADGGRLLDGRWRVAYPAADTLELHGPDGERYRVISLPAEATS